MRLYFHYVSITLRGQMQYKASFIMMSIGTFVMCGMEFVAIWALFDRFKILHGWSLPEAAMLYGIVNTAFSISEITACGFDMFSGIVKSGEIASCCVRETLFCKSWAKN